MRITNFIFISLFLSLLSHQAHSQTEVKESVHSIEIDAVIWAPSINNDSNISASSMGIITDTINHYVRENFTPELRFKYLRNLHRNFSIFTGLHIASQVILPATELSDNQIVFTPGAGFTPVGSTTPGFETSEYVKAQGHTITYISIPIGVRAIAHAYDNDRLNLSMSAKANFYPKQKIGSKEQYISALRSEVITLDTETSLSSNSKLTAGIELDLNYEMITKNDRNSLKIGILLNRNESIAFTLNPSLSSESFSFPFTYSFKAPVLGAYIGGAFVIGK